MSRVLGYNRDAIWETSVKELFPEALNGWLMYYKIHLNIGSETYSTFISRVTQLWSSWKCGRL
jgi:hypothetical protein